MKSTRRQFIKQAGAVTAGLVLSKKIELNEAIRYWAAQVLGADPPGELLVAQELDDEPVEVEPRPGVLSSRIAPPCSSTKRLVRARPRPVPSALRV